MNTWCIECWHKLTHWFHKSLSVHSSNKPRVQKTSNQHRSNTLVSEQCLIDVNPSIFAFWKTVHAHFVNLPFVCPTLMYSGNPGPGLGSMNPSRKSGRHCLYIMSLYNPPVSKRNLNTHDVRWNSRWNSFFWLASSVVTSKMYSSRFSG